MPRAAWPECTITPRASDVTSRVRVAVAVAVLISGTAGALWAHARLVRSEPPSGARLDVAPREIRLEFSENVSPVTSRVELVSPDSQHFALGLRADSGNGKTLLAAVPSLAVAGDYRVEWRLIGPDGHAVTGAFGFHVDTIRSGTASPPVPTTSARTAPRVVLFEPDSVVQVSLRFLYALSVTLLIGATVLSLFVMPRVDGAGEEMSLSVDRQLRSLAVLSATVLLVVMVIRLTVQALALSGSGRLATADLTAVVFQTSWGYAWLGIVASALGALLLLSSRRAGATPVWPAIAAACVVLALASPWLGHASATEPKAVAVGLDAAHVLGAGGWVGTLVAMTIVAVPRAVTVPAGRRATVIRSLLGAFTPVALGCAVLLVVSGAGEAWLQLDSLSALWSTPYGWALVRKLALVMLVAALGAWHWRIAQPALGSDRSMTMLRRSLALDVFVVVLVLILTAILTGTPTDSDVSRYTTE